MKKILVLAPHCDDECFIGGLIFRRVGMGDQVHVKFMGVGSSYVTTSFENRRSEMLKSQGILGFEVRGIVQGHEMALDEIRRAILVTDIDMVLSGYDEFYAPVPSQNHDHQIVHEIAVAAMRKVEHAPKLFALYEYPYSAPNAYPGGRMYVNISGEPLAMKLAALNCYQSQVRSMPSLSSLEAVSRLAKQRGAEAGVDAAELLYVQRMVL